MIVYYTADFSGGQSESRRLLAEAVAAYTGDRRRAGELTGSIFTGKNGKPYIDGFDFFSVSHTQNVWAVLLCERECGLDIQLPKKCRELSIAGKIYAPEDAAAVEAAFTEDPEKGRDSFFRIWTRREAFIKAVGGSVADSGMPSVLGSCAAHGGVTYSIRSIELPDMPEMFAAVCTEGYDVPGIKIRRLAPAAAEGRADGYIYEKH